MPVVTQRGDPGDHLSRSVRSLPATVNIPGIVKVTIHDADNVNLLSASF